MSEVDWWTLRYNICTRKMRSYNFRKRSPNEMKRVSICAEYIMISLKTQTVVHLCKLNSNPPSSQGVLGQLHNVKKCAWNKRLNMLHMRRGKAASDSFLWIRGQPKHQIKKKSSHIWIIVKSTNSWEILTPYFLDTPISYKYRHIRLL